MIGVYSFFWQRLINYAAKYQLQAPSVDEFNSNLDEVQKEAMNILAPHYQANEKVRSLLKPWVRQTLDTSDQNGYVSQPQRVAAEEPVTEEFYRILSMGVTDGNGNILYGISPAMEAEIVEMQRIPQRKPDLTKKRAYYISYDQIIQLYPSTGIPYLMFYLVEPTEAILAFTYSIVDGEYIQTYDAVNSVDLYWDDSAANLLLYLLLEKYGISSRDDLLQQYADMGIKMSLEAEGK